MAWVSLSMGIFQACMLVLLLGTGHSYVTGALEGASGTLAVFLAIALGQLAQGYRLRGSGSPASYLALAGILIGSSGPATMLVVIVQYLSRPA